MPPLEQWESFFAADGVLDALELNGVSGDVAEFGCGYGTFTLPAARRVSGIVFATDIDALMVSTTIDRASRANLNNVIVEQRDFIAQGCGQSDGSMSCVLLFNILHVEDPVGLLREACRVLRRGGIVGVIHWRHDVVTPRGPPPGIRPRPAQCCAWANRAGLRWTSSPVLPDAPWHWGMTFERPRVA